MRILSTAASTLSARARLGNIVAAGIAMLAFGMLPLQWLTVGGELRVSDIGFLLLGAILLLRYAAESDLRVRVTESPELAVATSFFVLYLFLYGASLAYSATPRLGLFNVVREVVYITFAVLIGAALRGMKPERLGKTLTWGLALALLSFCAVAFVMLRAQGVNLLQTYAVAIASGDPTAVQYSIYYRLFNQSMQDVSSAARHGINYLFVIGAISASALSMISPGQGKSRLNRLLTIAFIIVVVASLSRQALLPLVVYFVAVSFRWPRWGRIAGLVLIMAGGYFIANSVVRSTIQEKFIADVVDNPRLSEYRQAVQDIDRHPLSGEGAGTRVYGTVFAHNLFLHAWQQAGAPAAMAALGCLTFLIIGLIRAFWIAYRERGVEGYRAALTLGFLAIVLVRLMVGVRGALEPASAGAWGLALLLAPGMARTDRAADGPSARTPGD